MKKVIGLSLTLMLILSLTVGCQSSGKEESGTSGTTEENHFTVDKINVTYVSSPLNVPSIVEKEKGFFSKAFEEFNLPVEYSNLTTGPEQTQALASGDIQFLNAVGATSVILSAANGADIKIISTYSRSPEAFKLFAKDDSIQTAADLKGKKIAGPKGTILHELLVAYLATADLTQEDIEFVAMGIPEAQAAMANGSVDGALLAGPAAYNAEKDGGIVVTTGKNLVDATIVVATTGEFYEKNPLLVQRFLETQNEILAYMNNNHDEIIAITAQETELSEEAVREMFPMYDFSPEITEADIASMKQTVQFMEENEMIEQSVDIDGLILKVE